MKKLTVALMAMTVARNVAAQEKVDPSPMQGPGYIGPNEFSCGLWTQEQERRTHLAYTFEVWVYRLRERSELATEPPLSRPN